MNKTLTDWEIREIAENEGLAYTFTGYLSPDDIESTELRELARNLRDAYCDIAEYLANLEGT